MNTEIAGKNFRTVGEWTARQSYIDDSRARPEGDNGRRVAVREEQTSRRRRYIHTHTRTYNPIENTKRLTLGKRKRPTYDLACYAKQNNV